jgi:hypothetical protein
MKICYDFKHVLKGGGGRGMVGDCVTAIMLRCFLEKKLIISQNSLKQGMNYPFVILE